MSSAKRNALAAVSRQTDTVAARDVDPAAGGVSSAGQGLSAAKQINVPVFGVVGGPTAVLLSLIGVFVVSRFVLEANHKSDGDHPLKDVQVSLWNAFVIGFFAIIGIAITKAFAIQTLSPSNPVRQVIEFV